MLHTDSVFLNRIHIFERVHLRRTQGYHFLPPRILRAYVNMPMQNKNSVNALTFDGCMKESIPNFFGVEMIYGSLTEYQTMEGQCMMMLLIIYSASLALSRTFPAFRALSEMPERLLFVLWFDYLQIFCNLKTGHLQTSL